jgi:transcriptional regulator with XRE-family HTH domain
MIKDSEPNFPLYAALGARIRQLRKSQGLGQEQLADLVGVTRTSITNIEAGRQRVPLDRIYDIADALDVQAVDLLPPNGVV